MKKGKRLHFFLAAAAAAMTMGIVTSANVPQQATKTPQFKKYLIMEADDSVKVPPAAFSFTITPGEAREQEEKTIEKDGVSKTITIPGVMPGPAGASITETVSFQASDDTYKTVQDGDNLNLITSGTGSEKYAKKVITVTLPEISSFTKPGIYRYNITETQTSQVSGITMDAYATKYLDVYIVNENGTLQFGANALHDDINVVHTEDTPVIKRDGFTNRYSTFDLQLKKTVGGSQGDHNEYFRFTVQIPGAAAGSVFPVDLDYATKGSISLGSQTVQNPASLTADESGITATFYLKHNEHVVIEGISKDLKYTVTEVKPAKNYTTKHTINSGTQNAGLSTGEQTLDENDNVVFINILDGAIPTGILLTIAPYAAILLVVALAAVLLFGRKRRHIER